MNKIKLIFIVILNFLVLNNTFSQTVFPKAKEFKNQTNKKGLRTGDWIISYKKYDWSTSSTKIVIDLNHLEEIIIKDTDGTDNIYFLENVKYKGGLKIGMGYYYVYNQKTKRADPLAIVKYSEGKINGQVLYYNNFNEQNQYQKLYYDYFNAQNPFAKVYYKNGILEDQIIEKAPTIIDLIPENNNSELAIRVYEKISSGKSVEFQISPKYPNLENTEYFGIQLANKKLDNSSELNALLYKEILDDKFNKTIICIPFGNNRLTGLVTQYQQKVKIDSLGKIASYGLLTVFQTIDPQNFLNSSGIYPTGEEITGKTSDLERKHLGELPWTYFDGIDTEKSCLIYRAQLDQFDGTPNGEVLTYYFNEVLSPKIPNSEKLLKTKEQYSNGELEGLYTTFFENGKIKEKYNFKNGYLNGKGEIYVSKIDNYDFLLPKEKQKVGITYNETSISYGDVIITNAKNVINLFNVKSKSLIVPVAVIMAYVGKNYDKNYNDSYYDINKTDYFKFCDLEFEYNQDTKQSLLKNYDVLIGSDKFMECTVQNCNNCFKIFDKNKKVILSPDIMNAYNIKKEKQDEIEYQNMLTSEISCNWCGKKIILKDALYTDVCNCITQNNKSSQLYLSGKKYYCSRKCASDGEKQICRDNGFR